MSPTPGPPVELNDEARAAGALFDQDEVGPARPAGPEIESIPLPPVSSSRRAQRRRRRQRERRLVAGTVTGALVTAGIVVIASLGLFAGRQVVRQVTGHGPAAPAAPAAPLPVMIVQQDAAHVAVALAVLASGPGSKGGSILLIDPGTMAEVPSLGLQPLSQALAMGGADRLRTTVENLLGVPLGEVDVLDAAGVAQMVQASAPLHVDVPEAVERVQPGGLVQTVFPAGPQDVTAAQVPVLLATPGATGDLARLARQEAFFHAWLDRVRPDAGLLAAAPPGVRAQVQGLAAAASSVRVLPVDSIGRADDGTELYQPDAGQLSATVAQVFPSFHPVADRPSVQILNGTGALGLAQRVTDKLLPAGVQVKLTDNADRLNYTQTEVVYYEPAQQATAQKIRNTLGVGTLVLSRRPIDVVDVTVIVGKDFPTG